MGGAQLTRRALLQISAAAAFADFSEANATGGTSIPRSRVDAAGVWRWADGREVALFGVNYNIASAAAFRFAKASGVPFERIVETDFAHFKRMGFDALRLSYWGDFESSTGDGELVENEHLAVLDLVLARADRAGISCLLSPIVTYDAAWPDALGGPKTGLAGKHDKDVLGTDPAAIAAQVRYLCALLGRTNHLTGRRLADEPAIVAVEPINEPTHHSADRAGSIRYIEALGTAVRASGFTGPIFYNVTQDMGMAPAIAAAREVRGATFAWYPTGLQTGHDVAGNGLLLVDDYPQFQTPALARDAKLVYEFDAADTMASYYYPAMVREFRGGGAQFAAMFAYDSMAIAAANSEFNDHYLNLAYTPAKAISAMIAAAAMRELPRGRDYGRYPANMWFGAFRVDDRENMSELADATRFFHSNDTATMPPAPPRLRQLAGYGSSPLIETDSSGAWFLDKVGPASWRLEVYPDAALVANPFEFRRPGRAATRIVHRSRNFRVTLPSLMRNFPISLPDGRPAGRARGDAFQVTPGVYCLGSPIKVDPTFRAPPGERLAPLVQHVPPVSATEQRDLPVALAVVASEDPGEVILHIRRDKGFARLPMRAGVGFHYDVVVPPALMLPGMLHYYFTVGRKPAGLVSPDSAGSWPGDWDFPRRGGFRVPVLPADAPLVLFDAARDGERLIVPYGGYARFAGVALAPGPEGDPVVRLDGAAMAGAPEGDLPGQFAWNGPLNTQSRALDRFAAVEVQGRSLKTGFGTVGVMLIERDGTAWGAPVRLTAEGRPVRIPLTDLRPMRAAMLPRDFPKGINPYWLRTAAGRGGAGDRIRLADLQAVQFSLSRRFLGAGDDPAPVVEITRIALAR